MSGYKLLAKLGHKSTKLRPSLVQIKTSWGAISALKGVRANCHVQILRDGALFAESTGELQLTEQGISGPVVFEISRDVCYGAGEWSARLDFLPNLTEEKVNEIIVHRRASDLPMEELLTGILHNRLGRVLTKAAGVKGKEFARELSNREAEELCRMIKALEIPLTEPLGMDSAQVTAGGVLTAQFDENTMESRIVPGLYACGEVLDIDGDCGGYNLQWAWSSGRMAGLHAGKESK
jgi:predicted Rossmann fold flavoprotein